MLHCFTGGAELAQRGLALGGYVSFSGIVTFKNSEALRDIALAVPLDRLLVETDAPYLAPEPLRGQDQRAGLTWCITAARLAARAGRERRPRSRGPRRENFFRLFKKVPRSAA